MIDDESKIAAPPATVQLPTWYVDAEPTTDQLRELLAILAMSFGSVSAGLVLNFGDSTANFEVLNPALAGADDESENDAE